ncbi:MAG: alkaline phosphatase family protein [Clostridia bacterium]|nr:alkaline phosphatase family protein [Clostridia bacterium]
MRKNKKLIVISIDAMVTKDIEYARNLPNFKRIIDGAAMIPSVDTIYPTLTHPIHATLISGAPAGVTGVTNNLIFDKNDPVANKVWLNDLSQIRCDTLIHAAKRAGLTIATSTWPMTTYGQEYIDYLIPNALDFYFEGYEDDPLSAYRALGANDSVIDIIGSGIEKYGFADRHPEVDFFQFHCATEIIRRYQPDLLLMHPGNVDAARHKGGVWGEGVLKALTDVDAMLGSLLSVLEETDLIDSTDIVLLSDHGQIGSTRGAAVNVYLKKKGYITVAEDGSVKDWKAFVKSAGASAHVYLNDPCDKTLYSEIYSLLSDMAREGIYGFDAVYTDLEAREKFSLYGDFSFVLEGDGFTYFTEHFSEPAMRRYDYGDYSVGHGKHGHLPTKGPQPIFIGKGPSFKSGALIERGNILNHAPTLAKVLGVEIFDSVGIAEESILN